MVLQAIKYLRPSPDRSVPSLEILDQLALPHRSTYLHIHNCCDAYEAIKQMKVRGAPAIAIVAALALAVEIGGTVVEGNIGQDADSVKKFIHDKLDYLQTSRPTAVNLGDAVGKLKAVTERAALTQDATGGEVAEKYTLAAEAMLVRDVRDNEAIGKHGARWIQEHTTAGKRKTKERASELKILTHCNTGSLATAGYGTALGVIRSLHASKLLTRAYCSETRPYNQGSRLTAYELVHDQIPATLVTDSMAAALLAREGDNLAAIVVGADRVAANGDTANKIGTYSLAILARHHAVKFLVAAPRTTIDLSTHSGEAIIIEERLADEVTRIRGPKLGEQGQVRTDEEPTTVSIAAEGIEVWNPAFDVTPAELIDGIVTEMGVVEKGLDGRFDFKSLFHTEICSEVG